MFDNSNLEVVNARVFTVYPSESGVSVSPSLLLTKQVSPVPFFRVGTNRFGSHTMLLNYAPGHLRPEIVETTRKAWKEYSIRDEVGVIRNNGKRRRLPGIHAETDEFFFCKPTESAEHIVAVVRFLSCVHLNQALVKGEYFFYECCSSPEIMALGTKFDRHPDVLFFMHLGQAFGGLLSNRVTVSVEFGQSNEGTDLFVQEVQVD